MRKTHAGLDRSPAETHPDCPPRSAVFLLRRRNPHVDVLSHAQIELQKRLAHSSSDAERERRLGALFTTINGIAAGLQTAG